MKRIRLLVADHRFDDGLEALLEVAAKARTRQQRAHVERVNFHALERVGNFAVVHREREALGERGFSDARFADENRIVLAPPQQHVDRALEFFFAADQRIDFSLRRALCEVDGVSLQRLGGRDFAIAVLFAAAFGFVLTVSFFGAARLFLLLGNLGDAMRDEVDDIEARNILLLQKEKCRRFGLMEHRDQHIAAVDFGATG